MGKERYNDFEFISAYFDLELNEEEIHLFEKKANENLSFAKKVSIYKNSLEIVNDVDSNSEENLRRQKWVEIVKSSHKKRKVVTKQWIIGVAASLVISFFLFFYFMPKKTNYRMLAQKAWDKNIGLDFVLRTTTIDSTKIAVNKALNLYQKKQYHEVLSFLKYHNSSSNSYKEVLLLRALARYKVYETEKALKTLDTLGSYAPNISKWYKGLIYLDKNDLKTAKIYLLISDDPEKQIRLKK
jgi:hypothetical protein